MRDFADKIGAVKASAVSCRRCGALNAFIVVVIVHEGFVSLDHVSRNWSLGSFGNLSAEIGTHNGDQSAKPPSEARIARLQAHGIEESGKGRSEGSAQAGRGRRDAVDRAENLLARGRVRQQDCVARICHCRKGTLPDDQKVDGRHPQALWEKYHIWRDEIEGEVGECNEAKQAQRSQSAGHGRHNQIVRQQRIEALNRDDDANGLCLEPESVDKLERKLQNRLLGRGGAQEYREELVIGDGVA